MLELVPKVGARVILQKAYKNITIPSNLDGFMIGGTLLYVREVESFGLIIRMRRQMTSQNK